MPLRAVIFDLDGTLANIDHRLHHVTGRARDWDSFFAGIPDDTVREPIHSLFHMVASAHRDELGDPDRIFICTGRGEEYRETTEAWLSGHDLIGGDLPSMLLMRPAGDRRPDHVVKREMLRFIRDHDYDVVFVVDDRPSVVEMWRSEGVECFQCSSAQWTEERIVRRNADQKPPVLTLMVGPSGAGKSAVVRYLLGEPTPIPPNAVVSSDAVRDALCGDFRNQTRNDDVWRAVHRLIRTRLECGLDVLLDATNIRTKDRRAVVDLAPEGTDIVYIVVDRPLEDKIRDGGWRNEVLFPDGKTLIERHHQTMQSNIKAILSGDGDPRVEVLDWREPWTKNGHRHLEDDDFVELASYTFTG